MYLLQILIMNKDSFAKYQEKSSFWIRLKMSSFESYGTKILLVPYSSFQINILTIFGVLEVKHIAYADSCT